MDAERIVRLAMEAMYGRPLVNNVNRAVLVEAMVANALPGWNWCSGDYAAFDFQHPDGLRLEVKQSAFKQSWKTLRPSRPVWDIRHRTGYWEDGVRWIERHGRNADIYVLGLHPVYDETADHRRPDQWEFFVIAEPSLPQTQTINLAKARALADPVSIDDLPDAVAKAMQVLAQRAA